MKKGGKETEREREIKSGEEKRIIESSKELAKSLTNSTIPDSHSVDVRINGTLSIRVYKKKYKKIIIAIERKRR